IADNVIGLLGARDVVVYRLEPATGDLVSMAFAGEGAAGFSHPMVVPAGVGGSGLAVAQRAPLITTDMLNDPRLRYPSAMRAGLARAGYRAGMAVPLLIGGEPIGALAVAAGRGRVFDGDARRLLEAFADQAAVALHNARLFAAERVVWLRDSVTLEGPRLRSLKVDITSRKQAEAALQASEQQYRTLLNNIPDVAWLIDREGNTLFVSPHVERVSGYTEAEVRRAGANGWFARVHPDDRPLVRKCFAAPFE